MIIDSHCHLISSRYEKPINEIIDICEASNISLLLNIATKEKEFNEILSLSNKYKQIYNSVGIHPHETENLNKDIFIKIDDIIKNNKAPEITPKNLNFKLTNLKNFENNPIKTTLPHVKNNVL